MNFDYYIIFYSQLQQFMKNALIILLSLALSLAKEHPEAKLEFVAYCNYFKYPVEEHSVITEDGYILKVFRIQKKNTQIQAGLKPIFLQHGLMDSSDTWLINDEDKAPGFILANADYDVWLGNSRGNKHSRKHQTLNPDKNASFWEFTFQHMADYDIPAFFKYVGQYTKQKVHYIGHSQGTMQMHVALSKRNPIVEQYLDKYFAFGPVAYASYITSNVFKLIDKVGLLEWYKIRHIHQFMPSFGWFATDIGVLFCATFSKVCADILSQVMDADPSVDNYERYDVLVGHDPSGTSVMNMEHWKQIKDKKKFQAFDYGSAKENNAHYGQPYPPQWDLKQIRQPMRLFAGNTDELADLTDVNFLWDSLSPQVKEFYKVYNAGHCTFIWGNDVTPWMNDIFRMLKEQNLQTQC